MENPSNWNDKKLNEWFEKGEWLNGWNVNPDDSINRKTFAISYFRNKDRWDKAFRFMKDNDLNQLELKKFKIDGDNLFAVASEYQTCDEKDTRFEAHKNYIDLQYVAEGRELMGIAPLSMKKEDINPYNSEKDVVFVTVKQFENLRATPENFFLFFPDDIHRPKLKDGENSKVRKIVVKIKID